MLRSLYLLLGLFCCCNGARILGLVPTPSYSHQIIFQPIFKELAKRGHEVVLFSTNPINDKTLPNLKEGDWSGAYEIWNRNLTDIINSWNPLSFLMKVMKRVSDIEDFELGHPEIQKILKNETEHFDLVIIESMWVTMAPFKIRFNCPLVGITTLSAPGVAHRFMGNPVHYVLYPDFFVNLSETPTFLERLMAVIVSILIEIWGFLLYHYKIDCKIRSIYGEDYPPAYEIMSSTDMLFTNVNPIFGEIRPITPSTISIGGGIHINEPKELPKELKAFLDDEKEGVIYFSLGSNVKSKDISAETREIILKTFENVPFKILWKFEAEDLPGKPENVKIMKWVPQQDVLRHPNVKVFVTQGGLQSLEEALFSHVPVVVMPFFADQEYNAEKVSQKGMGRVVDHKKLTIAEFKEALMDVVNNSKYKETVVRLANLVKDEPMKPLEKAIWWIEYVMRNKGSQHLKGPARNISFYQYLYLDVISFLLFITIIILGTTYYVCKKTWACIYNKCFTKKEKTL